MTELAQTASLSARETLRQGLRISPELRRGIGVTLVVAVVATAGRLVIPVVVQRAMDDGIAGPAGARPDLVLRYVALAGIAVVVTALSSYVLNAVSYTHLDVYKRQVVRPASELRKSRTLRTYDDRAVTTTAIQAPAT